jgi:hypothetical protein
VTLFAQALVRLSFFSPKSLSFSGSFTALAVYYLITAGTALCLNSGGWPFECDIRYSSILHLPVIVKRLPKL